MTPLLYLSCDRGELLKWLFLWAKREKINLVYGISLPLFLGDNSLPTAEPVSAQLIHP